MANGPGDQSEDKIRELIERADRAERERQEIRDELREELQGIRGLLENAITQMEVSGQRKIIARALYEAGQDDERRDLGIPAQVRRHRRERGEGDKGHLRLVVPVWVAAAATGLAALSRTTTATAKAHPVALAGLRQAVTAGHLVKRHWLTTTAVGVVGVGTLAGVTHITLSPSVTSSRPPAAASAAPPSGPGAIVPLPSSSRPPPSPRAYLVKHHKAVPSPSPSVTPPAVAAQPSPSLLPATAPAVPVVTSPPASGPSGSPPSGQGPGIISPSVSPTVSVQAGVPPAGATVRHTLRGIVRIVRGITSSLTR